MGGSNGGLLVGATLTQRPDLAAAVVCSAPLLDMVRYELFGLGRTWNDEYGTAEDPTELGWLLGYSPYHAVREGTAYPAVLFTTFESDTRVDPLHGRKLAAALQHATSAAAPIVLRREDSVGHGARAVSRTVGPGRGPARPSWPRTPGCARRRRTRVVQVADRAALHLGVSPVMSRSQLVSAGDAARVPLSATAPAGDRARRRCHAGRRRSARSSPSASSGRCSAPSCCRRPATSWPASR